MDKYQLVNLCSRTWSLTALSLMARGVSCRVSPLAAAAGCGRTAMGASVEHLISLGLLERNPGHGHPLRPEYRLTPGGIYVAKWAKGLSNLIKSDQEQALMRNKWSLPLISCLPKERRYSDLRRELIPITDRALSGCIAKLTEESWIKRNVAINISPPTVTYRTLKTGQKIYTHLLQLPKVAYDIC